LKIILIQQINNKRLTLLLNHRIVAAVGVNVVDVHIAWFRPNEVTESFFKGIKSDNIDLLSEIGLVRIDNLTLL